MCEANAYLIHEGKEELIMESVDVVEPEGDDAYRLVNIFGDQTSVRGRIKGMFLVDHRIEFEAENTMKDDQSHSHGHDHEVHSHAHDHVHAHPHSHKNSKDGHTHGHDDHGHTDNDQEPHDHPHK